MTWARRRCVGYPTEHGLTCWRGHGWCIANPGPPVATRYTLEPSDEGHSICELGADGAATKCWRVARGEGGSLEGGRVFIDAHGERLRIAVVGDGPEQVIFQGNRDGCD